MTLQHELHDLKNQRRFHIGFRALPYAFYRHADTKNPREVIAPDGYRYAAQEEDADYHARLRALYPNEEALRAVMLKEWIENGGMCEQSNELCAYVGAVAAHAYRFCAEADWQIDCTSDSGDNYGRSGPRGAWPLVFSVYGDDYIDDDERPETPWALGQDRAEKQ